MTQFMVRHLDTSFFVYSPKFIGCLPPSYSKASAYDMSSGDVCIMRTRDKEAGKANIKLFIGWGMRKQCCAACRNQLPGQTIETLCVSKFA